MVVQKTIDNLKDRPKDERKVVAGGIAITAVVVLLIGWAVLFLRNIQNGTQQISFDAGAQNEFNPSNVTQAQQQIQAQNGATTDPIDDLYRIRDDAAAQQVQTSQQFQAQQTQGGTDAFGNPANY